MSDDWHNRPNAEDLYDDYLEENGLMVCEACGDECPQNNAFDSCDDCQEQRSFKEDDECLARGLLAMVSDGWESKMLEGYKEIEGEIKTCQRD